MEKKDICVIEVLNILESVEKALQERINTNFIPLKIRNDLRKLTEDGLDDKVVIFNEQRKQMYVEALQYVNI